MSLPLLLSLLFAFLLLSRIYDLLATALLPRASPACYRDGAARSPHTQYQSGCIPYPRYHPHRGTPTHLCAFRSSLSLVYVFFLFGITRAYAAYVLHTMPARAAWSTIATEHRTGAHLTVLTDLPYPRRTREASLLLVDAGDVSLFAMSVTFVSSPRAVDLNLSFPLQVAWHCRVTRPCEGTGTGLCYRGLEYTDGVRALCFYDLPRSGPRKQHSRTSSLAKTSRARISARLLCFFNFRCAWNCVRLVACPSRDRIRRRTRLSFSFFPFSSPFCYFFSFLI